MLLKMHGMLLKYLENSTKMSKEKKATQIYKEGYKEGDYVPGKEQLIDLIKKDQVTVCILERAKYSDGSEKIKISLKHP